MIFAVESALDELARRSSAIDPFELRRRNVVVPGDEFVDSQRRERRRPRRSAATASTSASTWRRHALRRGNGRAPPAGRQWRVGEGMAVAMIATIPPRGHFADASVHRRRRRRTYTVGSAPRSSATAPPPCTPSSSPPSWAPPPTGSPCANPTPTSPGYDTGAFGRRARWWRARRCSCCRNLRGSSWSGPPPRRRCAEPARCALTPDGGRSRRAASSDSPSWCPSD